MYNLHIEHPVPNYDNWKKAFDSDPAGRKNMGVRTYQVLRAKDDPNYVIIDLQFETVQQAEALLASMRKVWSQVDGQLVMGPQARIAEIVENKEITV